MSLFDDLHFRRSPFARSRSRERSGRGKWDSDGSGSDAVAAMQVRLAGACLLGCLVLVMMHPGGPSTGLACVQG